MTSFERGEPYSVNVGFPPEIGQYMEFDVELNLGTASKSVLISNFRHTVKITHFRCANWACCHCECTPPAVPFRVQNIGVHKARCFSFPLPTSVSLSVTGAKVAALGVVGYISISQLSKYAYMYMGIRI